MHSRLDLLIQLGYDITAIRYYVLATGTVLFYDYLLTLADEVEYVWCKKKTWAFYIFIFNRYFPMTYQLWQLAVSYAPRSPLNTKICEKTSFYPAFAFVVSTFVAQIVLTLRMYVVTRKSIPITVGFAVITCCQLGLGIMAVVFVVRGGAQTLPPIPLDAYHVCVFVQHKSLEVIYTAISLFYDFIAFWLTIYFIIRSKKAGLKLPIILKTIAEDATRYFLFIFTAHLVLELALALGRDSIQFLSSSACGNVVFLPVMISRLLLSLRKTAYSQQYGTPSTDRSAAAMSLRSLRFVRHRGSADRGGNDIPLVTYRQS